MKRLMGRHSLWVLMVLLTAASCRRHDETNKILDGQAINTTFTAVPIQATQQMSVLVKDTLSAAIPVINRIGTSSTDFAPLTGPDGSLNYGLTLTNNRFGSATYVVQFKDSTNATIAFNSSTSTFKSLVLTGTGSSALFTSTISLVISIQTEGNVNTDKFLAGALNFIGSSNNITYTFPSPGIAVTFLGVTRGPMTASGTGPMSQLVTGTFTYSSTHILDGSINWEGNQGTIHLNDFAAGILNLNQIRHILQ
jgi:hypothetical protein